MNPATKNQPGLLDVEFTALDFPNGRVYPITGALTSLDGKSVSRTASGRLLAKHTSSRPVATRALAIAPASA
jgi:hypothetical protein